MQARCVLGFIQRFLKLVPAHKSKIISLLFLDKFMPLCYHVYAKIIRLLLEDTMGSLNLLLRLHSALECRQFGSTSYDVYTWSLALCFGLHTLQYPKRETIRFSNEICPFSSEKIQSSSAEKFFKLVTDQLNLYPEGYPIRDAFKLLWGNLSDSSNNSSFLRLFEIWASFNSNSLSDAVDYLAHEFVGKFYPEVQTPQWLNRLAVLLIAPVSGSFYDGTAGIGDTSFEALQYAARNGGSLSVCTSELDNLFFSISLLRTWLQAVKMQQRNDDCFQQELKTRFDYSIMFPPLGDLGRVDRSNAAKDDASKDWRFAMHLLDSLSEEGKGVCCIFSGALFNSRSSKVRENLLEQNVIDAIISFPSNILNHTAVPISLVVFRRGRKSGDAVRLIDVSSLIDNTGFIAPALLDKIAQIYHTDSPVSDGVTRCVPPKELTRKNLLPSAYLEKELIPIYTDNWGELHIRSTQPSDWVELGNAAQIYTGINSALITPDGDGIPIQLVRLSDVQGDQLQSDIPTSYLCRSSAQKALSSQVRTWDILISSKGSAIKLCLITDEDVTNTIYPLYMSQHFLGIHVDQDHFDPLYIYLFLKSPVGLALLSQRQIGSSITILRKKDLEQLRFPYISLEKQYCCIDELQQQKTFIQEQMDILERKKKKAYVDFYNQIGLKPMIKEELW